MSTNLDGSTGLKQSTIGRRLPGRVARSGQIIVSLLNPRKFRAAVIPERYDTVECSAEFESSIQRLIHMQLLRCCNTRLPGHRSHHSGAERPVHVDESRTMTFSHSWLHLGTRFGSWRLGRLLATRSNRSQNFAEHASATLYGSGLANRPFAAPAFLLPDEVEHDPFAMEPDLDAAIDLLNTHYEALATVEPYTARTGHTVPSDTKSYSEILVALLTGISGRFRKKGSDLDDGSDVKAANFWSSIDRPRFNGCAPAGRTTDASKKANDVSAFDDMPHLFLVLWDEIGAAEGAPRCRIWVASPPRARDLSRDG